MTPGQKTPHQRHVSKTAQIQAKMEASTLIPADVKALNGSQGTDDPHTVVSAASLPQDPSSPRDSGHEEYQYLNLIRDILANGEHRPDR